MRGRLLGGAVLLGIVVLAYLLIGGGSDSDDDPKEASGGDATQVAAVIVRLERATRRRQFNVLCDDLFTRSARQRAGGKDCVALLRETAKDVRKARIRLLDVEVDGKRAKARVLTKAEGQTAVEETIDLVHERGRFRISALAS